MSYNKNKIMLVEEFKMRLAQTIFWCAPRANPSNPKGCLRTPHLRPGMFEESRFSAFDRVAASRKLYGGVKILQAEVPPALASGKLLAYFPEINLCDGAAENVTLEFLDVDNLPPWDTWVAYLEDDRDREYGGSCLIAWIPPPFIGFVNEGIWVNPERCLMWLADSHVNYKQELQQAGLLF